MEEVSFNGYSAGAVGRDLTTVASDEFDVGSGGGSCQLMNRKRPYQRIKDL